MLGLSLAASPAGDRGRAAAATLEARLRVVEVCEGVVRGPPPAAGAAALVGRQATAGVAGSVCLPPGGAVELGPRREVAAVVIAAVLVLARPQCDFALGYGDLIRHRDAAAVVTAGSWQAAEAQNAVINNNTNA